MSLTAIQICNLALAKLGDEAKVFDITGGTDKSMQATYCALFYGQALSVLLDKHPWTFAVRTAPLTAFSGTYVLSGSTLTCTVAGHGLMSGSSYLFGFDSQASVYDPAGAGTSYWVTVVDANTFTLTVPVGGLASGAMALVSPFWTYAYKVPADFYGVIDVREPSFSEVWQQPATQNYAFEGGVLYSNLQGAVLVYTSSAATNTAFFPPLFVEALAVLLASYLAGPILKGDVGVAAQQKLLGLFGSALKMATESDAQYRKVRPVYVPAGIAARTGMYGAQQGQGFRGLPPVVGGNNVT